MSTELPESESSASPIKYSNKMLENFKNKSNGELVRKASNLKFEKSSPSPSPSHYFIFLSVLYLTLNTLDSVMPQIQCPIRGCNYTTDDVNPAVAAALLMIHNNVHSVASHMYSPGSRETKSHKNTPSKYCKRFL